VNGHENLFDYIWRVVPQARAFLAAGAAIGLAEAVLVIVAVLRWRAARNQSRPVGRWPELAAPAGPLVLLAAAAWSIHDARSHFDVAMLTDDPAGRARLLADCFAGQLNAIPLGVLAIVPALVLATIAIAFQVSARLRLPLLTTLVLSVGLGLAGLGPLLAGAYEYAIALIKTLSGIAGVDSGMKSLMVPRALTEAHALYFDRGVSIAIAAVAIVTISSVFLFHREGGEIASPRRTWLWSGLCSVGAAAVWLVALPLRAENQTPWPENPQSGMSLVMASGRTPDLEGNDPLERAPIITIAPDQLLLDGQPEVPMTLAQDLRTLRHRVRVGLERVELLVFVSETRRPPRKNSPWMYVAYADCTKNPRKEPSTPQGNRWLRDCVDGALQLIRPASGSNQMAATP
jgi:hypothetical protein